MGSGQSAIGRHLDVLLDVAVAYITLQAVQEQVRLNEEFSIFNRIFMAIWQRVEVAGLPPRRPGVHCWYRPDKSRTAVRQLEQESSNDPCHGIEQMALTVVD